MDRNCTVCKVCLCQTVALRKESVDRNFNAMQIVIIVVESLSARRAWIEMDVTAKTGLFTSVALRKESVDRNPPVDTSSIKESLSLSARRAWIEISVRTYHTA